MHSPQCFRFLLSAGLAFTPLACTQEGDSGEVTGGETGSETPEPAESPCLDCDDTAWACSCTLEDNSVIFLDYYCWDGPEWVVDSECDKVCRFSILFGRRGDAHQVACATPISDRCHGWDPPSTVTFEATTGTYEVLAGAVSELVNDPAPLWSCDDALAVGLMEGGFRVEEANPGELLYELGLRDGDVVHAINEYPLQTVMDAGVAFAGLWLDQGATDFLLEVERDSDLQQLSYTLVER